MLLHCLLLLAAGAEPVLDSVERHAAQGLEARYSDAAGAHLVRFTFTAKTKKAGDEWERSLTLSITDTVGKKTLWKARDFVERCPFDATLDVDEGSIAVTDLDHDGVGEFSFLYSLGCRSDVSPLTVKLLMYEGAAKYALRGESRERVSETEYVGGTFTVDPAFGKAPADFLERAKATWNERVLHGE